MIARVLECIGLVVIWTHIWCKTFNAYFYEFCSLKSEHITYQFLFFTTELAVHNWLVRQNSWTKHYTVISIIIMTHL